MRSSLVVLLTFACLSSAARAEAPAHPLDLTLDAGWNGPAGIGLRGAWHGLSFVGITAAAGLSDGGALLSLGGRFYVHGSGDGIYVGAALQRTFGLTVTDHVDHHLSWLVNAKPRFTISPAVMLPLEIGYRAEFFGRVVVVPYAGYNVKLAGATLTPVNDYKITDIDRAIAPGGVIFGLSLGIAVG